MHWLSWSWERKKNILDESISVCGCVPRTQNENVGFLPGLRKSMFTRTRMSETWKGITWHASFPQKRSFLAFHLEQEIMCLLGIVQKLDLGLHNIYPLIWQTYSSTSDLNVLSIFYQISSTSKWHSFKINQTKPNQNHKKLKGFSFPNSERFTNFESGSFCGNSEVALLKG